MYHCGMTAKRPRVEQETIDALNEYLDDVIRVDPETVGLDQKIRILLGEHVTDEHTHEKLEDIEDSISSLHSTVKTMKHTVESDQTF